MSEKLKQNQVYQGTNIYFAGPVFSNNPPHTCVGVRLMVGGMRELVVNFGESLSGCVPYPVSIDEMVQEYGYERTGIYISVEDLLLLRSMANAARLEELKYEEKERERQGKGAPITAPKPYFYKEAMTFQHALIAQHGLDPETHKMIQMTGEIVRTKAAEKKEGAKKND